MEKLNKDELMLLALQLDNASLNKLCLTSKRMNKLLCDNKDFWRNKLYKEYPYTVGKFSNIYGVSNEVDFKRIYLSLLNREKHSYQFFMVYNNGNPIIYPYIKKKFTEEDYSIAEKLYPEMVETGGDPLSFEMIGDFPSGTKVYLSYLIDSDIGFLRGFLTQKKAVDELVDSIHYLIEEDYEQNENFAQMFEELSDRRQTPEEFYGGTLEQVKQRIREALIEKGYAVVPSYDPRREPFLFDIYLVLKELALP